MIYRSKLLLILCLGVFEIALAQTLKEQINGMFTDVKQAIADKNEQVIIDLAKKQTEAGATYLDVNVGTAAADQEGTMQWLVETIQKGCSTPLCLDSQKPDVIAAGLTVINADNGVILEPLNFFCHPSFSQCLIKFAVDQHLHESAHCVDDRTVAGDDDHDCQRAKRGRLDGLNFPVAHTKDRNDDHIDRVIQLPARGHVADNGDCANQ